MNDSIRKLFACPNHKTAFDASLYCPRCEREYPTINGIPVLINDENSIFLTDDYLHHAAYQGASSYAGSLDKRTGLRQMYRRIVHYMCETSPKKEFSLSDALASIFSNLPDAEVLVIGAGDTSISGHVTYTDVAFGANVHCIADAHDLPFLDKSFDVCVAVAVLEHVVDPYRCVSEMVRVLRPGGYVYAETPFMQPVHMGAHDFTRFTHLGHRRLFRHFDELRSGIAIGPGSSAGQLVSFAVASVSDRHAIRRWLKLLGLFVAYPFRWFDRWSYSNRSAYDSASGFYFFGKLRQLPITDRELLGFFRGG
jgi:SAM-dependent methyltransferase/uncharacterized protein YbaR (Trm112 family)